MRFFKRVKFALKLWLYKLGSGHDQEVKSEPIQGTIDNTALLAMMKAQEKNDRRD